MRAHIQLVVISVCLAGCGGNSASTPQTASVPATPATPSTPTIETQPTTGDVPLLTARESLGRHLFTDVNLSRPSGTSCASCHDPQRAFAGNHGGVQGVPLGSTGASGLRNTPSAMYAQFTPAFRVIADGGAARAVGGQFLDGRVDTLAQQALGPLLSAAEMNNPDAAAVVATVAASAYAEVFKGEWGADIFTRPEEAFIAIGESIAAYERSLDFRPFSSRYDDLLRGHDTFTASERRGMEAFFGPGRCATCHTADRTNPDPRASLFTNHQYVALGVPRNRTLAENADPTFFDLGLAGPKRSAPAGVPDAAGSFKVPTLRNVARRSAFMHNGVFTSLSEVVAFYATRDLDPRRWYPVGQRYDDLPSALRSNVTHRPPFDVAPGDPPRLTPRDVADIVDFLGTLSDPPFTSPVAVAQ
jgi:cytochrome c peroxidase